MKTTLSAKIKLHTTPEQFQALRATQLAYRDALNFVSRYAFAHGKMSNKVGLQDGTYTDLRQPVALGVPWLPDMGRNSAFLVQFMTISSHKTCYLTNV